MRKMVPSIAVAVILSACGPHERRTVDEDQQALKRENVSCKAPSFLEYDGWGPRGQMLSCKMMTGAFVAAEDGYVRIRGQFKDGRKAGVWRFYDEQGNVRKEIDYSSE